MIFSTTTKQWRLENGLDLFGQQEAPKANWSAASWLAAETDFCSTQVCLQSLGLMSLTNNAGTRLLAKHK